MFHSHLKYPVFYLLTEFQSPILKHESQTCCFYILFFLIFKLMFIFRTEFCIRQGFTSDWGWGIPRRYWFRMCSSHFFTHPKSTIFFHVFLKQKVFFFNKRFISVFFVYFDTNRKLLIMSCPWHQKMNSQILQFTNLKCCIKAN